MTKVCRKFLIDREELFTEKWNTNFIPLKGKGYERCELGTNIGFDETTRNFYGNMIIQKLAESNSSHFALLSQSTYKNYKWKKRYVYVSTAYGKGKFLKIYKGTK